MANLERAYGIKIGTMPSGPTATITDVPGVAVGHATVIAGDDIRTGVTAIIPAPDNLFALKLPAAAHVINGFGKSAGIPQLIELGTLETPILLTNTLCVGRAYDALVAWAIDHYSQPETPIMSINPVVGECNDAYLNNIHARAITRDHVFAALDSASSRPVEEGAVGAGTGMTAFGYKSGIGSASRSVVIGARTYTVGVLVLPNFGRREELTIAGIPVGRELSPPPTDPAGDGGSIIIVVGTDLPLSPRQLRRIAVRAGFGLARTGSYGHSGSGDFVIAFSTANRVPYTKDAGLLTETRINDARGALDPAFQAVVEATEEAIISALFAAETVTGRDGHVRHAIPTDKVLALLRVHGVLIAPGD